MTIIENIFSEENYLVGEALYENGGVTKAEKLKGNIWHLTVDAEAGYNVEIKGFDTKILKHSCDCNTYLSDKQCPHIVASCLYIRNKKSKDTVKKVKSKKSSHLNISAVLDNVTHEELKRFVKQVAKHDRSLNFMLKSVFAPKIDLEDNAKKYSDLLSPLIKPATGIKSSLADTRLSIKLISEFKDQLEDALVTGQYTTVFDIIKGVMYKIHYLYRHYPNTRIRTGEFISSFNVYISQLYTNSLAPKLLDELDKVVVEVASLSYYNYLDLENDLAYQLYRYKRSIALDSLSVEIAEIKISRLSPEEQPIVVALKHLLDIKEEKKVNLTDQQHIEVSSILARWDNHEKGINYLLYLQKPKERNRTIEYAVINAYHQAGQTDKANDLTIEYYIKYREYRFVRILKDINDGEINATLEKKISKLISALEGHHKYKAMWYREVENDKALLTTLADSQELRLIMEYDRYLYNNHFVQLEAIYLSAIDAYLDSHVGNIATTFITEVQQHLSHIRAFKLQSSLRKHLEKNHSHRMLVSDFK